LRKTRSTLTVPATQSMSPHRSASNSPTRSRLLVAAASSSTLSIDP
jgi:hypothetical protein